MGQYVQNVIKNTFPLSIEKKDLKVAFQEWAYTGNRKDLESATGDCQLCDHDSIRYHFEIQNLKNQNKLLVGSECIHKFEIPVTDKNGNFLSGADARKIVMRDKRELIKNAAFARITKNLKELGNVDNWFKDEEEGGLRYAGFINYFLENNGFTIKQLLAVMGKFQRYGIAYKQSDYRLKLHRKKTARLKDEELLGGKSKEDIKTILSCMTKAQVELWRKLRVEKFNPRAERKSSR